MAKMQVHLAGEDCRDVSVSSRLEWLLTDGQGGYAMGTASGINTRRYHGHWVPAVVPPTDRWVLLDSIEAHAVVSGTSYALSANQYPGALHPEGFRHLDSFEARRDAVVWSFDLGGSRLEKHLAIRPGEAQVRYVNGSNRAVTLYARPLVCHKPYHTNFRARDDYPGALEVFDDGLVVGAEWPLELKFPGALCRATHGWYYRFERERERERGLDPLDDLFCPCELEVVLDPGMEWTLTARVLGVPPLSDPPSEPSSIFLVRGSERTSILAGYPWFTDWGRDTMIALPGLCLKSGRVDLARAILRDYASQIRKGLIPNRFVESGAEPEYHTVDASLWFCRAAHLALMAEWDEPFARGMQAAVQEVVDWYRVGTLFGIRMDPSDGLLTQGGDDLQLTWMDAKIGDWVVTPRAGKPVEINGLWINALRVLGWLNEQLGGNGQPEREAADLAEASFHNRFWDAERGWYRDVVDPDDSSLRPNQVMAIAVEHGPFEPLHAQAALEQVRRHLLTPFGLRTLAPFEPNYAGRYEGSLAELDARYHQGTVWPYLLGFYAMACRRAGVEPELSLDDGITRTYGLGGVAEVFDGDAPHRPGGCPWQAWSHAVLIEAGLVDPARLL